MNFRKRTAFWCVTMLAVLSLPTAAQAQTNPFTKAQLEIASAKWKTAWTNSATISTIADKTPRTAPTRLRTVERQHDARVRVQQTQTLERTKPSKQKTTLKMPWTI